MIHFRKKMQCNDTMLPERERERERERGVDRQREKTGGGWMDG